MSAPDLFDRIRAYALEDERDLPGPVETLSDAQLLEILREEVRTAADAFCRELGAVEHDALDALVPHDADDDASALRWLAELWEVATGRDAVRALARDEEQP